MNIKSHTAPKKPLKRFCPLCKSLLGPKDTLKGTIMTKKPPQQILIRGCTKCTSDDWGQTEDVDGQVKTK